MIENATNMMDRKTTASAPALEHHFLDVVSSVDACGENMNFYNQSPNPI